MCRWYYLLKWLPIILVYQSVYGLKSMVVYDCLILKLIMKSIRLKNRSFPVSTQKFIRVYNKQCFR